MSISTLTHGASSTGSLPIDQTIQGNYIADCDNIEYGHSETSAFTSSSENNIASPFGERSVGAEIEQDGFARDHVEPEAGEAARVDQVNQRDYPPRNIAFSNIQARKNTFRFWQRQSFHEIDRLVEAGFFYTDQQDIVRCFHCDIGLAEWSPDDDPWIEHARHSQDCPYLRNCKGQLFVLNVQKDWSKIYKPKHTNMSTVQQRLESFNNDDWPADFVVQTPAQLAEAGFFYTGETDTVRCHYCDGGLREWDPDYVPWVEHARWFPFCKYVLKIKGLEFIRNSAVENALPDEAENIGRQRENDNLRIVMQPESYVDKCRRKELNNPMFTAAAESIMDLGYSTNVTKGAINIYIEQTGKRDFTSDKLLNIIFKMEEGNGFPCGEDDVSLDELGENMEFQLTAKALRKENEYLKQKLLCIDCKNRERVIVFTPCSHRLYCNECHKAHQNCTICGLEIESRVKTFLG